MTFGHPKWLSTGGLAPLGFTEEGRSCLEGFSCCIHCLRDHWGLKISTGFSPALEILSRKVAESYGLGEKLQNSKYFHPTMLYSPSPTQKVPVFWQVDYPGGQMVFWVQPWEGLAEALFPLFHTPSAKGRCVTWTPCPQNTRTGISIISKERVLTAREYK